MTERIRLRTASHEFRNMVRDDFRSPIVNFCEVCGIDLPAEFVVEYVMNSLMTLQDFYDASAQSIKERQQAKIKNQLTERIKEL